MKIAVIGSGISGLSAAYYLSKKHNVDLFEREDYFGGHSHTIDIIINDKMIPVDVGFIVFNFQTYPNLINFFKEIDVEIEKSDMSFSVSVENTNFETDTKVNDIVFSEGKYYGAKNGEDTLKFFEVHQSADIIHRQVIKDLIGDVCDTDEKKEEALEAIELALSSLNNFLSGMERVYC